MNSIIKYFTTNFGNLSNSDIDLKIIQRINKLNRNHRSILRNNLFEKGKIFKESKSSEQIVDWLQACFWLIDKYSFRFNNVYFSPGNEIKETILQLLKNAHSTVDLCVFTTFYWCFTVPNHLFMH